MSASTRSRPVLRCWMLVALPLAAACKSDSLKPEPVPEPSNVYWDLLLDKHAVTLSTTAPYDTTKVFATPRNYQGEPLAGLPPVTFSSLRPEIVSVTSEGLLTARSSANAIAMVVATMTSGNLTHKDTVLVRVVDNPTPPLLETFSIQPVPPDSAKWYASPAGYTSSARVLNPLVHATYAGGVPVSTADIADPASGVGTLQIADMLVSFRSSDTSVATLTLVGTGDPNLPAVYLLNGVRHGNVDLYASATLFGVTMKDTLHFRVGYPLRQSVTPTQVTPGGSVNYFPESSVIVGTGGIVEWTNNTPNTTEVIFANPTNVHPFNEATFLPPDYFNIYCFYLDYTGDSCAGGGNFTLPPPNSTPLGVSYVIRTFPVPGVYEYHNAEGKTARVVVSDE